MSELFQSVNGPVSEEQALEIAKTGVVPSHLKSPEDKVYYVIFRNSLLDLTSQASEDTSIDGEALIMVGRYNTFQAIKNYLRNDGEESTDLEKSIVMVEGVDAAKGISLHRFLQLCIKAYPEETEIDEAFLEMFGVDLYNVQEKQAVATGFGDNAGTVLNKEE